MNDQVALLLLRRGHTVMPRLMPVSLNHNGAQRVMQALEVADEVVASVQEESVDASGHRRNPVAGAHELLPMVTVVRF